MGPGTETDRRPPAWHPDPSGRHRLRWWNGQAWTDRVSDGREVTRDIPARPAAASSGGTDQRSEPSPPDGQLPGAAADQPLAAPDSPVEVARPKGMTLLGEPGRLATEQRPSTAAAEADDGGSRWRLLLSLGAATVVVGSLLWGWHHHGTARQWQERAGDLREALAQSRSNTDALQRGLSESASDRARLEDSQQVVAGLQDATQATVDQIITCARALDSLIVVIGQENTATVVDRANRACGDAVGNAEMLNQILRELTE